MELSGRGPDSPPVRHARSGPVPTTEFECEIIEELNQERLRQSRIIARQHDTIGKLNRALEQLMHRDSRRLSFTSSAANKSPTHSLSPIPDLGFCDAGVQTDVTIGDDISNPEDLKRILGMVTAENRKLLAMNRSVDRELYKERERAKRIIAVCTRISTSDVSPPGLTSPTLAKWISLGLEDSKYTGRGRVGSADDLDLDLPSERRNRRRHRSSSYSSTNDSPKRAFLSEGNSPIKGVDLDMMYGSFEPVTDMPNEAVALTPKATDSFDARFLTNHVAGTYLVNSRTAVIIRLGPNRTIPLVGSIPSEGHPPASSNSFTVTGTTTRLIATLSQTNFRIYGIYREGKIFWDNPPDCSRLPFGSSNWQKCHFIPAGDWWTGFTMIHLQKNEDMSGTSRGRWGLRTAELRLVECLGDDQDSPYSEWIIELVLGSPTAPVGGSAVTMQGVLSPKYIKRRGSMSGGDLTSSRALSVIHWGNGQFWEQQGSD